MGLEEGNVIFVVRNEDTWRHYYQEGVVQKKEIQQNLMDIRGEYN